MADGTPRARRMRFDAAENRAKVLAAAKLVFAERGARASLNEVAKRAGVGSATLYRHFPSLPALLVAIVGDDVRALCDRGRDLLRHDDPDTALTRWLRDFATHASTMQGLLATQLAVEFAPGDGNALAAGHDAILATGSALLDRSRRAGSTAVDADIRDVLRLVNAIAWASQQVPDDADLIDRLFALSFGTTRPRRSDPPRSPAAAPPPRPSR